MGGARELKTAWYQLRLVKPLARGVTPVVAGLKRLETELGEDHNLVGARRDAPRLFGTEGDERRGARRSTRWRRGCCQGLRARVCDGRPPPPQGTGRLCVLAATFWRNRPR